MSHRFVIRSRSVLVPGGRPRGADTLKQLVVGEEEEAREVEPLHLKVVVETLLHDLEELVLEDLREAMGKLGDGLTKKQMKAVEELSRGIVNKLLHGPMQALRSDGTDPAQVSQTLVNMHALEDMFDLKNDGVPGSRNGKK